MVVLLVASSNRSFSLGGCSRRGSGNISPFFNLLRGSLKSVDFVLAVLLDEVRQILNGTGARILNGRILSTGGIEFDGRESGDGIRNVVGSSIDLGNGDLIFEITSIESR